MTAAFTRKAVEDGLDTAGCGLRILEAQRTLDPTSPGAQTPGHVAQAGDARSQDQPIDANKIFESRSHACSTLRNSR
jgi:hypothetical protein